MTTKANWVNVLTDAVKANLSAQTGHIGSRFDHIESIEFVGTDSEGHWEFEVKTWNEGNESPETVKRVSLRELCDLIGYAIADGLIERICSLDWHEENPGLLP